MTVLAARSEMQFEQFRLLLGEYRAEAEQMATASGACT
jgi:hypothetical protein